MTQGSSSPTNIPVKTKETFLPHGNVRQRTTENAAGRQLGEVHKIEYSEADKHSAILAADARAAELCSKGKQLYGGARYRWIAGMCGVTVREVKYVLRR